ncbi:MAG: hypothetical protein ABEI99_09705 [Halobaculum sp.]
MAALCTAGTVAVAGCGRLGSETATPQLSGDWVLRARVENADDQPREYTVTTRAVNPDSAASASGTLPAGETTTLALAGGRSREDREIVAESANGAVSQPWRPTDCRRLFADVVIRDGRPQMETECREAQTPDG